MISEYIDEIHQRLEQVQREHALSDRAVAAAIQMFVRTGDFPEGPAQQPQIQRPLLETAWLFFLAAVSHRSRYLLVSSMHLNLVMAGDRPLEALFEELRNLEEHTAERSDDEPDWLGDYRRIARRPFPDDDGRTEELQSRFEEIRSLLADRHDDVLDFSRQLLSELAEQFDQDVQQGAISPLSATETADVEDPDEAFEQARECQKQGDLDAALHLYSKVLDQRPDDVEARVQRGILRATLEDLEGACEDFDRVIEHDEDHLVARLNRGLARHSLGEVDEAIADYDHALSLVDDNPEIWTNRGIARFSKDDFEGALRDLNRAIELDDSLAQAYFHRGNVHRVLNDVRPALQDYESAIELQPDSVEPLAARGFLYLQLEDAEQARRNFDRAIELQPSDPELYYNRAYAHLLDEDVDEAIADYDQALELDPEDVEALANRGAAHMMNGDLEAAAEDWEQAIAIDPYYPTPYLKRASMWIATGDYDQAIEDLEIALEHAPDSWEYRAKVEETLDDLRNDGEL